ncbi:hypothetical protein SAMN05216597_0927 [Pseudomonas cannabina]|nr:hypothetical protein SAMN05216597_0927 [Pseudomonas cannabina]
MPTHWHDKRCSGHLSSRADFSYRAWDGYVLRFHIGKDAIWPLCLPEIQSLKAVNEEKE